ncbi:anti-sigma factor [Parafrankia sp. EUN1f]|uniref:anti-sigma factor family protein n=1 Tax=Parafrankia sp. EUN1f TaxID=102897 RepID=UPI0001C468E2|nr:zf-HC2 domain-containing protein [Parafrankia sp. EUN1f]EFC80394.1 hypothetical protein FrEUN1fDRAFT_6488 [Parafrankia sp. EUN1f]
MSSHLGVLVTPLVDGQLGHDDRDRALAHLTRCPACQAEVAEQRFLKARLVGLAEPSLPSGLAANLLGLGAREYQAALRATPASSAPQPLMGAASGFVAVRPVVRRPAAELTVAGSRPGGLARAPRPFRPAGPFAGGGVSLARPAAGAGRPPGGARGRAAWSVPGGALWVAAGGATRVAGPSARRPAPHPRSSNRSRMRRTLVGSAAVMLLAVSGSALADAGAVARPSDLPAIPAPTSAAAIPANAPAINMMRPSPMIATVSFPRP